jgi:thiamine pyrophosphokinase
MAEAVVIADGTFPVHPIPLGYLKRAGMVVCCDGSTASLVAFGIEPDAIAGDMDSLGESLLSRFADRIHPDSDQETNDLTKAVNWCRKNGFNDVIILGASGKREDHTIGNISLLAEYVRDGSARMITDSGIFYAFTSGFEIEVEKGQQVSVFSINPENEITSEGLLYPLSARKLTNWWQGTLNEAASHTIKLDFSNGTLILFVKFMD